MRRYANSKGTASDAGQAGELLVAADLLRRGLPATKPLNTNGPDDLHAKFGEVWKTIQVKLGLVNQRTGNISVNRRGEKISSDIEAWVDLRGFRIRYISNTAHPLPEELSSDFLSPVVSYSVSSEVPETRMDTGDLRISSSKIEAGGN